MTVSLKTQKMLWGRAAARCAMSECRRPLVEDLSETDDPTLVGENCHINAESDGGPRSDETIPDADRNRYSNLILLCKIHHKIIDDNEAVWTVEKLKELKASHETWVEQSLGLDCPKLRDDTLYGDYIDEWARRAHLNGWTGWSSYILGSGQPHIRADVDDDIEELRHWLLGRIWPGRYPELERAFENFRRVLEDFHETLRSHLERHPGHSVRFTTIFYRISEWNPTRYGQLSMRYDFHVDLVSDLMLELTRAANLICDLVRRYIAHNYRLADGHLIVQRGPDMKLRWVEYATRYSAKEAAMECPYPGLESFYVARSERDWTVGEGRPYTNLRPI